MNNRFSKHMHTFIERNCESYRVVENDMFPWRIRVWIRTDKKYIITAAKQCGVAVREKTILHFYTLPTFSSPLPKLNYILYFVGRYMFLHLRDMGGPISTPTFWKYTYACNIPTKIFSFVRGLLLFYSIFSFPTLGKLIFSNFFVVRGNKQVILCFYFFLSFQLSLALAATRKHVLHYCLSISLLHCYRRFLLCV